MITADQRNTLRIAHLERQQKQESLDRVESTVDKVTHEDIVGLWAVSADAEQLHQVVELTVNIAANLHEKGLSERWKIKMLLTVMGELIC